ncbi:hypothetical protein WN51_12110 [Melipona quadrifasciata]|uniref:Uncharacterized protein n=1 Tax=Melipona quadrifasciata TaxID=166423 RepID=A0A0M9A5S2_9HYME|nr:hypothetical protein WN51_12110 [Melipona quadrifasciata]
MGSQDKSLIVIVPLHSGFLNCEVFTYASECSLFLTLKEETHRGESLGTSVSHDSCRKEAKMHTSVYQRRTPKDALTMENFFSESTKHLFQASFTYGKNCFSQLFLELFCT